MKFLITILFLLTVVTPLFGQVNNSEKSFFKNKTQIDNPFSLRDPFKAPPRQKSQSARKRLYEEGKFSNVPTIESVPIKNIKITGVFIGKERRAVARVAGINDEKNSTVILREGMKLGQDGAELKAILPGGIVLVEKIINVYGQEEYLETIIPIVEDAEADKK